MCTEIYKYRLLPQINCTREWPVEFVHHHDRKFGYLSGFSHEIQVEASTVDCSAPTFIFNMEDVTVHLSNRTIITPISS